MSIMRCANPDGESCANLPHRVRRVQGRCILFFVSCYCLWLLAPIWGRSPFVCVCRTLGMLRQASVLPPCCFGWSLVLSCDLRPGLSSRTMCLDPCGVYLMINE